MAISSGIKSDVCGPNRAYTAGYEDGLEWDLDGFDVDGADVARAKSGWDEATISAMGARACAKEWGVKDVDGDEWDAACSEYNRGAHAGACAPQSMRSGLPARGGERDIVTGALV